MIFLAREVSIINVIINRIYADLYCDVFEDENIEEISDEFVDDFNIFFDQLKYTTNTLSNIFDGYELKDIDFGDSSSSSSSEDAK